MQPVTEKIIDLPKLSVVTPSLCVWSIPCFERQDTSHHVHREDASILTKAQEQSP